MIALRCGLAILLVACTEVDVPGAFDDLPLDAELDLAGLDGRVQIARDKYGIAHINATSVHDAGFAQGYVTAHDRLIQMDLLRRFATGRLAEIYATDDTVLDTDVEMRFYRFDTFAKETRSAMPRADVPLDAEVVALLDGYAEGVNAYADDLLAGKWALDPAIDEVFVPHVERFALPDDRWTAADSLAILHLYTFGAAWTLPDELAFAELYDGIRGSPRAALAEDLARFQPIVDRSTITGFPPTGLTDDPTPITNAQTRPAIAASLYADGRSLFRPTARTGPGEHLGPHALFQPDVSGASIAVGPERTTAIDALRPGPALLASTHNAQLGNPSHFYPTHLTTTSLDVVGVTLPGVPGVLYGTNGTVAWTGTPARHDVNDVYLVDASESFIDELKIGADTVDLELEVTDRGPVLPNYDASIHTIVPHAAGEPRLVVEFPGYGPSFELAALWALANTRSLDDARAAIANLSGDQSWMLIDSARAISWSTTPLPQRPLDALAWHASDRPGDTAPMFVFDGTVTTFDWAGNIPAENLPSARDPDAGYLVAAGADPVGATFDNDPINGPSGLYTGAAYTAGLQHDRIATLIETAGLIGEDTLTEIQLDTRSNAGAVLRDRLVATLDAVLSQVTVEGPPASRAGSRVFDETIDRRRVELARDLLAGWSFETPTAANLTFPAATDSAATLLFNGWLAAFARRILCDEPAAVLAGCSLERFPADTLLRLVHAVLVRPETLVAKTPDGTPLLCDDATTLGFETCGTASVLAALDAMDEIILLTGSESPADWRWGAHHQLVLEASVPPGAANPMRLRLPDDGSGFPLAGDQFSIAVADHYRGAFALARPDGAALRMLAVARLDAPIELRLQVPGGTIFDARDPHYRDLLDRYLRGEYFVVPYSATQIIDAGEYRWELR